MAPCNKNILILGTFTEGAQVQSLVGKRRSYQLCGTAKKKKNKANTTTPQTKNRQANKKHHSHLNQAVDTAQSEPACCCGWLLSRFSRVRLCATP